ncbi:MAG: XylR family transcriptional regulator [Verrucomicrobia bacterium]|jgi:LacI family transcriptional regulator|nr:XylR family transcriptional regulator [Verrucomicrobiota bacterium]
MKPPAQAATRRRAPSRSRQASNANWLAVLVDTSTTWGRQIITGIVNSTRRRKFLKVMVEARGMEEDLQVPKNLKCIGVIARVTSEKMADELKALRLPVVNVSSISVANAGFPRIISDMDKVAEMAFQHLWERGFRHFAYFGLRGLNYTLLQRNAIRNRVKAVGCQYAELSVDTHLGAEPDWGGGLKVVSAWLQTLCKPVGIFTWNASSAREIIYACLADGLLVPEEIAVLSGAEDDLLCEASPIPISAIMQAAQQIGFQAAELLEEMRRGRKGSGEPLLIAPLQVVNRQSTEALILKDKALARAMDFLRQTDPKDIKISDLARQAGLGRRALERRFREVLRRSPADEIRRARLDSARKLLGETDLPISTVAEAAGIATQSYFASIFGTHFGMTPLQYRNQSRPR